MRAGTSTTILAASLFLFGSFASIGCTVRTDEDTGSRSPLSRAPEGSEDEEGSIDPAGGPGNGSLSDDPYEPPITQAPEQE